MDVQQLKVIIKNHISLFNNNIDYNDGWFLGRNRCKHLLVIDDEKEGDSE